MTRAGELGIQKPPGMLVFLFLLDGDFFCPPTVVGGPPNSAQTYVDMYNVLCK